MKSVFIQEQQRYSFSQISSLLDISEKETDQIIRRLKSYNILKVVNKTNEQSNLTELIEEEELITDNSLDTDERFYVFKFVGIVMVGDFVFKCYPKYVKNSDKDSVLKQIIKVLDKYNVKEQIVPLFTDEDNPSSFNMLSLMVYIINDYNQNGHYTNHKEIIEVNGEGAILWEKTINEMFTLIHNNRPYYPEMLTRKNTFDNEDYFKRLHESVVSYCSKILENASLVDLFSLSAVNISDEPISDFGDLDYILYKIEQELSVQFNTRKQNILKMLFAFLAESVYLNDNESFNFYGTGSFHTVWEAVCASIFGNKLDRPVSQIKQLKAEAKNKSTLKEIIEFPQWIIDGETYTPKGTLIPDLITVIESKGTNYFLILDAKYYTPRFLRNYTVENQPGIGDITKQYLYQLAYRKLLSNNNIDTVINSFVMPTEDNVVKQIGIACMPMLKNLELEDIRVLKLPSKIAFDKYLYNQQFDDDEIIDFFSKHE